MTHPDAEMSTLGQNLTPTSGNQVSPPAESPQTTKPDDKPETVPDQRLTQQKEAKASQTVRARVVSGAVVDRDLDAAEGTAKRVRVSMGQILDAVQHRIPVSDHGDMEKAVMQAVPAIVAAAMGAKNALATNLEALKKARQQMHPSFRREFDGILVGAAELEMRNRIQPLIECLAGEP